MAYIFVDMYRFLKRQLFHNHECHEIALACFNLSNRVD